MRNRSVLAIPHKDYYGKKGHCHNTSCCIALPNINSSPENITQIILQRKMKIKRKQNNIMAESG